MLDTSIYWKNLIQPTYWGTKYVEKRPRAVKSTGRRVDWDEKWCKGSEMQGKNNLARYGNQKKNFWTIRYNMATKKWLTEDRFRLWVQHDFHQLDIPTSFDIPGKWKDMRYTFILGSNPKNDPDPILPFNIQYDEFQPFFRFGNLNTSLRGFENNKETASYWDLNICRQSPTTESCFNPSLFLTFVFWGKFERKKLKPCHMGGHESLDDKFKSSRNILIFIVGGKSLFIWLLIIINGTIEFVQDWRGESDTEREEISMFLAIGVS